MGAAVFRVDPEVTLEGRGIRLEPMRREHEAALQAAAADGRLWELHFTSVPEPEKTLAYIETALADCARGVRVPWVVRETARGQIIGSTSYHDIIPAARRVEIGYTWYARTWQRTAVNSACKLRLLEHAFDTLGCSVVGLRTDNVNFRSQAAIERLGAKKDGVLRRHAQRRDGSLRDTVMYSITAEEWAAEGRSRLEGFLAKGTTGP